MFQLVARSLVNVRTVKITGGHIIYMSDNIRNSTSIDVVTMDNLWEVVQVHVLLRHQQIELSKV